MMNVHFHIIDKPIRKLEALWNKMHGPKIWARLDGANAHYTGGESDKWRQLTASCWIKPASKDIRMNITTRATEIKTRVGWFVLGFSSAAIIGITVILKLLEAP